MIFHNWALIPRPLQVGTVWLFTADDMWVCPKDGNYSLELHGCGGTATFYYFGHETRRYVFVSGGGSGNLETEQLQGGTKYAISIGTNENSGTTSMETESGQSFSIAKGGNASASPSSQSPGAGVGNIAGSGGYKDITKPGYGESIVPGGAGNTSKPDQPYGNGASTSTGGHDRPGNPGAVIITYLGD